jgi:hypothetical protein
MLARRQLPALLLPIKPLRVAPRVLPVAAIGAAAVLLAPLAARVAALSRGAVQLRAGAGGAVLGALAGDVPPPHPALLPFAGFPFGMGAAELRHWLRSGDGMALWDAGFAACGLRAWPIAVVTRGGASPHGTVVELQLGGPRDAALEEMLAAACDSDFEFTTYMCAAAHPATPESIACWLQDQLATPEARRMRVAERYVAARISALANGGVSRG